MPHIHELAKYREKWQRDLTRSVVTILALLVMAVLGTIFWRLV